MTSPKRQEANDIERVGDDLSALAARLKERRREVNDAIGAYPAPIPACDAQFNHLLEERDRLSKVLGRINSLVTACQVGRIDPVSTGTLMDELRSLDPDLAVQLGTSLGID